MKAILLVSLLATCVLAWQSGEEVLLDEPLAGLVERQSLVNKLLYKVYEPIQTKFSEIKKAAKRYVPEDHKSYYTDKGKAVSKLKSNIIDKSGSRSLPQHRWFSLFNNKHREEAILFFESLIYAKSWNIFANTAAHFREIINEGMFVYGFYAAITHSEFTKGIVLPPLYEVTPHMFANNEVIEKAYSAKMRQIPGKFRMSFTGTKKNPEQRVAYFGEDIGLNVHHVTWHMDFPFWWRDLYGHHIDRKGELFFWMHHQLTARFDSERLSNNLDLVDELYWDKPIVDGFSPHTTYKYGGEFPSRPDNVIFQDVEIDGGARVRDMLIFENRIRDAIAHGYVTDYDGKPINIRNEEGIELLGDIIEASEYSPNIQYYGSLHNLAHIMLGRQGDPKGKFAESPSVMEHFETATRDPAFFRFHRYMDNFFKEHKDSLTPYTSKEIDFVGVSLEKLSVDGKLETFFEDFEFELGNGLDDIESGEDLEITAVVSRLNHVPFNYHFEIYNNNDADVLGTIRTYLCPTEDSNGIVFTWDIGRWGCIELDKFWRTLKHGKNVIERSSADSSVASPDRPAFRHIVERTKTAKKTGEEIGLEEYTRSCGIPNRLLIPKGKKEGMKFDLVIAVTDGKYDAAIPGLEKDIVGNHALCGIHGETYPDKRPMGYPFDRRIEDPRIFEHAANINYIHVNIYHRD